MLIMGILGMPRRYHDYLPEYQPYHVASTVGSWILVIGMIVMIWNLVRSARKGNIAPDNPWGGPTLEWQTSSPPPTLNFDYEPVVESGPYDFSKILKENKKNK
jgi:cytochrome c oxidase subunit 1